MRRPSGVVLDDPENIRRHARLIEINAVRSHAMPPGNITEITPEERQILAAWIAAGAPGAGLRGRMQAAPPLNLYG